MPVKINGQTYYRTAEVCLMVGIGIKKASWRRPNTETEEGGGCLLRVK